MVAYRLQYLNADADVSVVTKGVKESLYFESLPSAFWTLPPIAPSVARGLLVLLYHVYSPLRSSVRLTEGLANDYVQKSAYDYSVQWTYVSYLPPSLSKGPPIACAVPPRAPVGAVQIMSARVFGLARVNTQCTTY